MDTKFQKKHESDMTSKEKRELEREKLASMHGLEKAEYILTYYKLYIVAALVIILAAYGIPKWINNMVNDETYLYVAVVDAATEGENFIEDFRASLGDEEEHHKYLLDTGIFHTVTLDGGSELDYNAKVKLSSMVGSGSVDVLICPKDIYDLYSTEDEEERVLYQMTELMGEEFVSEHQELCIEDAILMEDNEVLEKYGLSIDEPAYLIVFEYTKHPETAKEFVHFLMD